VNVQLGNFSPENKFTGQKHDQESGLYNYGARYYEAAVGRFNQSDPLQNYLVTNIEEKTGKKLTKLEGQWKKWAIALKILPKDRR